MIFHAKRFLRIDFLGLRVYNFVVLFHVFPPRPSPNTFTPNLSCKILEASCVVPRTFFWYTFLTFDFIKSFFLSFLWVFLLSSNITLINVRYIHFSWNLSLLPRRNETKLSILFSRGCMFSPYNFLNPLY